MNVVCSNHQKRTECIRIKNGAAGNACGSVLDLMREKSFDYTNSRKNAISDRVRHISKKLRSNRAELLICRAWPSSRRGTQETTPPALHHHLRYLLSVPHGRSVAASGWKYAAAGGSPAFICWRIVPRERAGVRASWPDPCPAGGRSSTTIFDGVAHRLHRAASRLRNVFCPCAAGLFFDRGSHESAIWQD